MFELNIMAKTGGRKGGRERMGKERGGNFLVDEGHKYSCSIIIFIFSFREEKRKRGGGEEEVKVRAYLFVNFMACCLVVHRKMGWSEFIFFCWLFV